jgi:hypothetical protein
MARVQAEASSTSGKRKLATGKRQPEKPYPSSNTSLPTWPGKRESELSQ